MKPCTVVQMYVFFSDAGTLDGDLSLLCEGMLMADSKHNDLAAKVCEVIATLARDGKINIIDNTWRCFVGMARCFNVQDIKFKRTKFTVCVCNASL